jgi:hypothetical protein
VNSLCADIHYVRREEEEEDKRIEYYYTLLKGVEKIKSRLR